MSAAQRLLDRLGGKIKQTSPSRWICRCPAHEDRCPSLSIRELEDGRLLIHCFAGCGAADIVSAVGLTLADLFDKPLNYPDGLPPIRSGWSARELLELNAHEVMVASLITKDAENRPLTAEERQRLAQAASYRVMRSSNMR
jgi:hypothetical protein